MTKYICLKKENETAQQNESMFQHISTLYGQTKCKKSSKHVYELHIH